MSKTPNLNTKLPKKSIIVNRKAKFDYELEDFYEAGIALQGWEVKSLRSHKAQLIDSYVIIKNSEAFLLGTVITPLPTTSTHFTPEPQRTRKLLLHKKQIARLRGLLDRKGYSLIPTELYWYGNNIKLAFALAKGKNMHDKRHAEKEKSMQRELQKWKKQ